MNRNVLTAIVALLVVSAGVSAQAPQAGPEHKRMAYFAGTWIFSGTAKDSPMGPGGPVTFKEACEVMDGGFALVCRSEGKNQAGSTKAAAIMTYDTAKKAYTYTAAESNMPVFTANGTTDGPTWTWISEGQMGPQKIFVRVTTKEAGPKTYDFAMEVSLDGKTFARVIEGKATKA